MKYKYWLLILLLYGYISASAQPRYEAPLAKVEKDGFYKISLTPFIAGRCRIGQQDLRIVDDIRNEIPYHHYFLKQEKDTSDPSFLIVADGLSKDKHYFVVVENKEKSFFDRLILNLRYSPGITNATIYGSNGQNQWKVIKDCSPVEIEYWNEALRTQSTACLSLPPTNYRFLKIEIDSVLQNAIKITSVYPQTVSNSVNMGYVEVPKPRISQTNDCDNGTSRVVFHFDLLYPISKIEFEVSGSACVSRFASIDMNITMASHEGTLKIGNGVQAIRLLGEPFYKEIVMEISNNGEAPVKITNARGFQYSKEIITYLQANKSYKLTFGDSLATAPNYDLEYFKDSVGKTVPELAVGEIRELNYGDATEKHPAQPDRKWLMWAMIIALLAILSGVTWAMVKKLNNEA